MAAQGSVEELLELGSATLGESGGRPFGPALRPVWPGARLAGPAYTVRLAPGDNLAAHLAVTLAPPGSVLVVAVTGPPDRGFWGEILTTAAEARGIAGLVIDGGVRDVDALAAHGFPVFSAGIVLRGADKYGPGDVGGPVVLAGAQVRPGDWIVGDADGLVAIATDDRDDVLSAARARFDTEQALMAALRRGATTIDLLGLDASSVTRSA